MWWMFESYRNKLWMEYNVLVMECLQTKDLFSSPPPPWCVLLVTSTLVQWNLNLTKGLVKFVHHNKVFKYPGSVFLKLLLLLGLGNSFVTPRPSICRGSSYLGSTLPGHYLLQASSIIINLSSSITGVWIKLRNCWTSWSKIKISWLWVKTSLKNLRM